MELIITTIIAALPQVCPRYFFGRPSASIRTEADAINAIKSFCEMAPAEVIEATAEELHTLSEVCHPVYQAINDLLWKVSIESPLSDYASHNIFELLNCSLKD